MTAAYEPSLQVRYVSRNQFAGFKVLDSGVWKPSPVAQPQDLLREVIMFPKKSPSEVTALHFYMTDKPCSCHFLYNLHKTECTELFVKKAQRSTASTGGNCDILNPS